VNDPGDADRAPLALDEWPYLQIADRLEDRIRRGEFGTDGKLPATAYLAGHYGVSQYVIRHAREELLRRNLVVHRLGEGWFARVPLRLRRAGFP